MAYGANHGDWPALLLAYGYADLRVGDQSVGFKHFLDFMFSLQLGKPGNVKAHGNQRNTDGAGLADAQIAAEFRNIENLDGDEITGTDDVICGRGYARCSSKRANALVGLLRCFDGLCSAGRSLNQYKKQCGGGDTLTRQPQSGRLHENG